MNEAKWKILKDFPLYKKDEIEDESNIKININIKCLDDYPDWFEKVTENKIKVGSWVKHENWDVLFRVTSIEDNEHYSAKLSPISKYIGNDFKAEELLNKMWFKTSQLATKEEILAHLSAEARFRGFKSGVRFNGLFTPCEFIKSGYVWFNYNTANDSLEFWSYLTKNVDGPDLYEGKSFMVIYSKGTWAEIVKEPKYIPYDSCLSLLGTNVKAKENSSCIYLVTAATKNSIKINGAIEKDNWISAQRLLDEYTFSNGSSCGQLIKKEN